MDQLSETADALALYDRIDSLHPNLPLIRQRLIALHTRSGNLEAARSLLEKSASETPDHPGPTLALTRFLWNHRQNDPKQKDEALRMAGKAMDRFPESPDAVDLLVRLHLADQNRKNAQSVITRALQSRSKDPWFWLALVNPARNAFPLDDPDVYAEHFAIVSTGIHKALTLNPEDPNIQETAGDFFARNRLPDQALPLYEKAAAQRPGNLKIRQKLGQVLRITGREEEASSLFESLVGIDPGDTISHRALISLYEKTDVSRALTHRAEVLRLENGDPRDYTTTTTELLKAGRKTEALTLIRRGIFFNPASPQLLYLQARVFSENDDLPGALDSLAEAETMATEKQPGLLDAAFYYSWGSLSQRAGRWEDAEKRFRESIGKASRKAPEQAAPAYHDLGYLWLSQNKNLDAAGELLRTANDLVKDHPPYLDSLGWWHFQKGEYAEAVVLLRRAVELSQPNPQPEWLDHLSKAEAKAKSDTNPATPAPD